MTNHRDWLQGMRTGRTAMSWLTSAADSDVYNVNLSCFMKARKIKCCAGTQYETNRPKHSIIRIYPGCVVA